jgi:hypothetical protein
MANPAVDKLRAAVEDLISKREAEEAAEVPHPAEQQLSEIEKELEEITAKISSTTETSSMAATTVPSGEPVVDTEETHEPN